MSKEGERQTDTFPFLKSYEIQSVNELYYKVVRRLGVNQEQEPGIYSKEDIYTVSYFVITEGGVNHWISKARFAAGVRKVRQEAKNKKYWRRVLEAGLPGLGSDPSASPAPVFPKPRPEAAIWVETENRPGGIFFAPYLTHAKPPTVDKPCPLLPPNSTLV